MEVRAESDEEFEVTQAGKLKSEANFSLTVDVNRKKKEKAWARMKQTLRTRVTSTPNAADLSVE